MERMSKDFDKGKTHCQKISIKEKPITQKSQNCETLHFSMSCKENSRVVNQKGELDFGFGF